MIAHTFIDSIYSVKTAFVIKFVYFTIGDQWTRQNCGAQLLLSCCRTSLNTLLKFSEFSERMYHSIWNTVSNEGICFIRNLRRKFTSSFSLIRKENSLALFFLLRGKFTSSVQGLKFWYDFSMPLITTRTIICSIIRIIATIMQQTLLS